ncbi:MAG: DUF2807 domain-containing protein [Eubacteriales bacterium]
MFFEGFDFYIEDVKVSTSSTGSASIYVTGKLEARISGTGNIIYDGEPTSVIVNGGGMGSIQLRYTITYLII